MNHKQWEFGGFLANTARYKYRLILRDPAQKLVELMNRST